MPLPVPPADSHFISLDKFNQMKKVYSDNEETILDPAFRGKEILCTSEVFNNDAVKVVQSAVGCAGLKIYYGMDSELKVHAMIIAVDKDGNELLPSKDGTFAANVLGDPPAIIDESQRCPPRC